MDIKVAKLQDGSEAILLGVDALPERLSRHTGLLVAKWASLIDSYQAISAFELAARIRHVGVSTDDQVDASLLEEFATEAREHLSNQSRVLYRLDDALMP